jgi:tripartite ATP-independent transporter DctM subunit
MFLMGIVGPAWSYALDEAEILTPALQISDMWRASALPVGLSLMLLSAVLQMLRVVSQPALWAGFAGAAGLSAAASLLAPVLPQLGNINLILFFAGVTSVTVALSVPIAFCFGLATFAYLLLTTDVPTLVAVGRMDAGMSNPVLLAVPLFVLLGSIIAANGMAGAIVRFLVSTVGHIRGGMSYVLLGAIYLVSGIAGSKAADMAAVAPALFPEMRARGAKPGELVALLAAAGAMSETVPPSLVLITIGTVTSVSISALFTGGLLPGVVLALALAAVARWRARCDDLSVARRASLPEIGRALMLALPALILPFVIRAAVVGGVTTATEVSTVGIVYAMLLGPVFYRRIPWREIGPILVHAAALSGAILLIIGTATAMSWALTQSGFSHQLAGMMGHLPGGKAGFLAVSVVAFVVLGSVLEGIPAIVLFGPLLFPTARQLGIHEVHYAVVVVLAMGIGLFAPPFGVMYYTACAIGRVPPHEGIRPLTGYLVALLAGLAIIAAIPWISVGFL